MPVIDDYKWNRQLLTALENHKTHELYNKALELLREKYSKIPNALNKNQIVDISFTRQLDLVWIAEKNVKKAKALCDEAKESDEWAKKKARKKLAEAEEILHVCLANIKTAEQIVENAKGLYKKATDSGKWVEWAKIELGNANRKLKESKIVDISNHIYIRCDKMIVQRTKDNWNEYSITIDTKHEEPIRSNHLNNSFYNSVNSRRYTFNGDKQNEIFTDYEWFYNIINEYINKDCNVETLVGEFMNYTDESLEWSNMFDDLLKWLCSDFGILEKDLEKKKICITLNEKGRKYRLKISKNEVFVECLYNDTILCDWMDKDNKTYWKKVLKGLFSDQWKTNPFKKIAQYLKNWNHFESIEFNPIIFRGIISLFRDNKDHKEKFTIKKTRINF